MFSTYALQGIETKTKGVYTREELAPLAQTNVESLKEFGFFTFAKADGKKQRFLRAGRLLSRIQGRGAGAALHPAVQDAVQDEAAGARSLRPDLLRRLRAGRRKIRSAWSARRPTCTLAIQRPTDGTATAQKLNEQTFMNGDNSNFGAMFANKITVDCP